MKAHASRPSPGLLLLGIAALVPLQLGAEQSPDIVDVLNVPQVSAPRLSPDGSSALYSVTVPDWEQNTYDSEIVLSIGTEDPRPVTNVPNGSASNAQWAVGSDAFFFIADLGQGPQIQMQTLSESAPVPVTATPGGLVDYAVSPNGEELALLLGEAPDANLLARPQELGRFTIVGEHQPSAHLWLVDIDAAIEEGGANPHKSEAVRQLTGGSDMSVTLFSEAGLRRSFSFSPDGGEIVFSHADSALILDTIRSDISIVDTVTGDVRPIVESAHWDETPVFSPDGTEILFGRSVIDDWLEDKALMRVPASGGEPHQLAVTFQDNVRDTQPLLIGWGQQGIDAFFLDGTDRQVFRIDPETGLARRITSGERRVLEADVSSDGETIVFVGVDAETAPEVFRSGLSAGGQADRLSRTSSALDGWRRHEASGVRWTADDGRQIEGVLYTPAGLPEPAAAPLIIVLHGGPRDVAYPSRLHNQMYPIEQWLDRGARVLFPNYRGSTGYGAAFRQLIVGNTGHAEMRDITSAVEHFVSAGLADENAVGVVGHSWGGYLSAFAVTTTDLFSAASVGAGITDNRVNYVLSVAGVAEEGYLKSSPWIEPDLWSATSPAAHVTGDEAPTLIQHGVDDAVVPVANAHIFYTALSDMGAPTRLVLFDETGHYVSRPREMRAWMQQNLDWFSLHLWRDETGPGIGN